MSNNEQTHYEGCFKAQGHHDCAVTAIERLQAKVALLDLSPAQHNVLERMFVAEAERDALKAKLAEVSAERTEKHDALQSAFRSIESLKDQRAELQEQLAAVTRERDALKPDAWKDVYIP